MALRWRLGTRRSKHEILATLDKSGRLEGLPFMPQMLKYCGRSFKVRSRTRHATPSTAPADVGLLAGFIWIFAVTVRPTEAARQRA